MPRHTEVTTDRVIPIMTRLSAKKFLLTYPHLNESPVQVLRHINGLRTIKRGMGCLELHEPNPENISEEHPTGELPHVHLAIEFEEKLNTTNFRFFDYEGYHPNISPAVSWAKCVNYCRKEGNLEVHYFNCDEEDATAPSQENEALDLFAAARAVADRNEWTNYCQQHGIGFQREQFVWQQLHNPRRDAITVYDDDELDPANQPTGEAAEWLRGIELPADVLAPAKKSFVLLGPTGIGKSIRLRQLAPKPALFIRHIDSLRYFDPAVHKSIIFDELRFNINQNGGRHWPIASQNVLVDTEIVQEVHCRYNPAIIPAGTTKLFSFTDTVGLTRVDEIERRVWVADAYNRRQSPGQLAAPGRWLSDSALGFQ